MTVETADLLAALDRAARDVLGKGAVRSFLVEDGEDSDGDPVIFVTIVFPDSRKLNDSSALLQFKLRARDEFEAVNEQRFPIFSFVRADEYDKYAAA